MKKKIKKIEEEPLIDWKDIGNRIMKMPWFVWAIIVLIVAGIVFYGVGKIISNEFNTIEYKDLTFTKEKYGEVIMYHYFYSFVNKNKEVVRYNMYLQNDPRKNPATYEGDMTLDAHNVYLSIDTDAIGNCSNSRLAVGKLSEFFVSNDFNITVATPDLESANKYNTSIANCETNPDDLVVLLTSGNKTKVTQNNRCFVIEANDCQILEASERFMVESVAEAKARSLREGYNLTKAN